MEQSNSMDIDDSPVFVTRPHDHDVLCGRGGKANNHPGNVRFRELVKQKKPTYVALRFKREKGLISEGIVNEIKRLDPPGRFLIYDGKVKQWLEISERKAKRKTAQALREKAPADRKRLSVTRMQAATAARSVSGGNRSPWQNSMENVMGKFSSAFGCCGNANDAADNTAMCPPLTKSYDHSIGDPLPLPQRPDILGYSFGESSKSFTTEESTLISSMQDSVDTDGMFGTCDICHNCSQECECYDEIMADSDDTKIAAPVISVDEDELMRSEIITPPHRNMNGEVCHGLDDFFAAKNDFEPLFDIDINDDALQAEAVSSANFKSG